MSIQKPEYSYSHVLIAAGHTLDETLLSKLCSENMTAIGLAVREPKVMNKEIFFPAAEGKTPQQAFEFMKKVIEGTKAHSRIVSFHSMPAEFDEDVEIMPWAVLKDSKNNPLLFAAIDGDFPNFIDKSADHFSECYGVLNEFLGPKIDAMYKHGSNNPAKLFDYLRSTDFGRDFEAIMGHRGVVQFLPILGEPWSQGKNEIGARVPNEWNVTNSYGYTPSVAAAATPAAEVKEPPKPKASGSKYVTEDTPPAQPIQPAAPIQAPANNPQEMEEVEQYIRPPAGLHGKNAKKWWRASPYGDLPPNWREIAEDKAHKGVLVKVKKPKADTAPPKKTETAISAAMAAAEATRSMPIISGDKQKASNEFIKKYVGDGSALISDPKETGEQESKLAKWHELHGYKDLAEVNRWTPAFLASYVKQHPEAAWLLVIAMRSEMNRLTKVIGGLVKGEAKVGDLVGTEAPVSPAPTPSTETEVKEEPKKVAAGGKSKYV